MLAYVAGAVRMLSASGLVLQEPKESIDKCPTALG